MPTEFWAEAVTTMVYIVNQSSTSMVENLTPYEALTRSRPNVEHFKVFGCLTFSLVDPQLRAKFDAKSRKGIFIGYNNCSKAYKVVDPITKKINIDWDIQFFEKRSQDWVKGNDVVSSTFAQVGDKDENLNNEQLSVSPASNS